jgi:hypothetical protein
MPDQPQHPPDDSSRPSQAPDADTYDLLPVEPAPPPAASPPAVPRNSLKGAGPRFIDTVGDDEDITDEGPVFGSERPFGERAGHPDERRPILVDSAGPDAGVLAMVGAGIALGGAVAAAIVAADGRWFAEAVRVLLYVGIHVVTGVIALATVAHLLGKAFGDFGAAFARMLCAVAALMVGLAVDLPIPGRYVEPLVGVGVYLLAVFLLFRRPWKDVGKIAMFHFLIGMVVMAVLFVFVWATKGRGA